MCSCHSILECCVTFSGVKLSIRSFVLYLVRWDDWHDTEFDKFLQGNAVPSCFYCNCYGHYAPSCPLKPAESGIKARPLSREPMTRPQGNFSLPSSVRNITKSADVMQDALLLPTDVIALDVVETIQVSNVPCYETPGATCGHELVADTECSLLADTFVPFTETFDSRLNHNLAVLLPETLDSMRNHSLLIDNFVPLPANPTSLVNIEKLKEELAGYPDPELADYLIQGFTYGFDIGYCGKCFPLRSKNLHSAPSNASAVTEAISEELSRGHVAGPFIKAPFGTCTVPHWEQCQRKMGPIVISLTSPPCQEDP